MEVTTDIIYLNLHIKYPKQIFRRQVDKPVEPLLEQLKENFQKSQHEIYKLYHDEENITVVFIAASNDWIDDLNCY